ncbi:hypothetical protein QJS04_geneDACA023255 [Acorus gramineus]|uniref:Rapid ALkalinization Factor n=1 Tax=Acorus gramineus TaxID=55184 RepID=A0AAV9A5N0_ACOGR|nr:hypothetical protein QJS04_geneDACA023255 [Acorus gramineus]
MVKQKMQFLSLALLIIVVLFVQANLATMSSFSAHVTTATTTCNGSSSSSVRECIKEEVNDDYEWSMESETSRRILQATNSISKPALRANQPVCRVTPGGQYVGSGCIPLPSNQLRRPCQARYMCRGG